MNPDYYYTDGEYEIRGYISHKIIAGAEAVHNIMETAKSETFKLEDVEKTLLEKFKTSNVKYIYFRRDLVSARGYTFYTSKNDNNADRGIYRVPNDNTYVGYVINALTN